MHAAAFAWKECVMLPSSSNVKSCARHDDHALCYLTNNIVGIALKLHILLRIKAHSCTDPVGEDEVVPHIEVHLTV
eukprot:1795224-Heterocapsa_arctica.AAC.1